MCASVRVGVGAWERVFYLNVEKNVMVVDITMPRGLMTRLCSTATKQPILWV